MGSAVITGQPVTEVHSLMSAVLDGASLPRVRGRSSDGLSPIALNAAKAEKELDWKPTVDLAEGTRRTIRWLCATLERESPALLGAGGRRSRAPKGYWKWSPAGL
jgi:nucleoside-diphosphate-sugar epimerase